MFKKKNNDEDEKKDTKKLWFIVFSIIGGAFSIYVGLTYGPWQAGVAGLLFSIVITIVLIVFAFLNFEKLNKQGKWFDTAEQLGDQQQRVLDHYSRIIGTLQFWKSKAIAHYRLHLARVIWSLLSGVTLPVLVQFYDKTIPSAVLFMTIYTTWTGFIIVLAFTLRSEEKYQGFRQQESDFYDKSRELLDFAKNNAPNLEKKVDEYIETINQIRKVGRKVETNSPPSALLDGTGEQTRW